MKAIGLLGGSFNPIHTGHLLLAESARDQFNLDQVLFIPAGNNPFKELSAEVGREHRLKMVELAIASNPGFSVSTVELKKPGITYTIETIRKIKEENSCDSYYFIIGSDILYEITNWREAPELLKSICFITTFRPGTPHGKLDDRIEELRDIYDARIFKLYTTEMDISSSDIRGRVKHGYSIKYLLPEVVEKYIYTHNLYQINPGVTDEN